MPVTALTASLRSGCPSRFAAIPASARRPFATLTTGTRAVVLGGVRHDNCSPALDRLRNEAVAIDRASAHRDEDVARAHPPRIVLDTCDFNAGSACAKHFYAAQCVFDQHL